MRSVSMCARRTYHLPFESSSTEYFNKDGDSGSCICGLDGRVGGILDGGSDGQRGKHDVGYATPIDSILHDIEHKVSYSSAIPRDKAATTYYRRGLFANKSRLYLVW